MRRADRGVVLGPYWSSPERCLLEHALSLGVRDLDTAYNYQWSTSHQVLARVAGELLGEFTLSTKVGFFANGDPAGCAQHSLETARLREAVERGSRPHTGSRVPTQSGAHSRRVTDQRRPLSAGRRVQRAGRDRRGQPVPRLGDRRSIVKVIDEDTFGVQPRALLLRAGLSVPHPVLSAGEQMCRVLGAAPNRRWG
jgi:pyridoxine 4-dehydrogenase